MNWKPFSKKPKLQAVPPAPPVPFPKKPDPPPTTPKQEDPDDELRRYIKFSAHGDGRIGVSVPTVVSGEIFSMGTHAAARIIEHIERAIVAAEVITGERCIQPTAVPDLEDEEDEVEEDESDEEDGTP